MHHYNYAATGDVIEFFIAVYNLKSEIFWENLKIHAGGDDKMLIQFAWPYIPSSNLRFCGYEVIMV